jgi:16S rRNA (adenine1518-N6/adenine1519-N6)-dimethyltransferase
VAKTRKRFAQHFLEPQWVTKLVATIAPHPSDRFIEIGPGRGAITEPLAAAVQSILAIEVDRDLAGDLATRPVRNLIVYNGDVLQVDLAKIAEELAPPVRVVGNLPYNISSPILFRLLGASASGRFSDATLMLQKEVADRLVARVGTGEYGVLTLSTMLRADVVQLMALPPGAFRPVPKVRSAVVRLNFRPPPPEVHDERLTTDIIRSVFTQRRKTLANALAPIAALHHRRAREVLEAANIDPQRRPETLSLVEFARLADVLTQPPTAGS